MSLEKNLLEQKYSNTQQMISELHKVMHAFNKAAGLDFDSRQLVLNLQLTVDELIDETQLINKEFWVPAPPAMPVAQGKAVAQPSENQSKREMIQQSKQIQKLQKQIDQI